MQTASELPQAYKTIIVDLINPIPMQIHMQNKSI